jgi:methylenetetrahydrofolate dehydrogenase (NADP+)/methenyltetrahydrofolate cyclohydrolase
MKINSKKIAQIIIKNLKKQVRKLKKKPILAVFLVGESLESFSFVKTKEKMAKKIGAKFQLYHFKKTPSFEAFVNKIKKVASNKDITGVIIQKPLPASLNTASLFNYIPQTKEIEGHRKKSPFYPPLGMAVLSILKNIFQPINKKTIDQLLIFEKDRPFFKKILKHKKIVLIGRGETGGKPIAETLANFKTNHLIVHSRTPNPESFYQEADIIISAVGKKVITKEFLKPEVILINVGLRKENGVWKGDYDEEEIKKIVSFYTPVTGGVGPLNVACLLYNLVESTKMQQ